MVLYQLRTADSSLPAHDKHLPDLLCFSLHLYPLLVLFALLLSLTFYPEQYCHPISSIYFK